VRWETPDGLEVLVPDDDPDRSALGARALGGRAALTARALDFLRGWLHDGFSAERGDFELVTLEVTASRAEGVGDVVLRFVFTLSADPQEYGYTWFDVLLDEQDHPLHPWWPVEVRIGFW
jgi:hypothetical protein